MMPIPDGMRPEDYPPLKAARVFTVNGRPIRMAGGSMVPDFLLTWSAQEYRDQVRLMTEGNHTVIRVWGGGIVLPDAFYEEADRRGLLVWQDLARGSVEAS
jgi:beta-mannosidase